MQFGDCLSVLHKKAWVVLLLSYSGRKRQALGDLVYKCTDTNVPLHAGCARLFHICSLHICVCKGKGDSIQVLNHNVPVGDYHIVWWKTRKFKDKPYAFLIDISVYQNEIEILQVFSSCIVLSERQRRRWGTTYIWDSCICCSLETNRDFVLIVSYNYHWNNIHCHTKKRWWY